MRQLTVISGKGGTGKTTLTACFASLSENSVFADCDVDAADLHLILEPKIKVKKNFYGLKIASINEDKCIKCMKCYENCRFDAISDEIKLKKESCEGCKLCEYICPVDAIEMIDRKSGFSYISDTRFGPMAHANLKTAEEASGKLVTVVRENAKKIAEEQKKELIIIDGPPGISCPVISAISGVDLVLVVTEPTLSAILDLKRVIGVADHFKIPSIVCINKYDINQKNTEKIQDFCEKKDIEIVGKIPYDTVFTKALIHKKNIIEYSTGNTSDKVVEMWNKIKKRLK